MKSHLLFSHASPRRRFAALFALVLLLVLTLLPAAMSRAESEETARVFDNARLFNSREAFQLQGGLADASERISADLVVVTVNTDTGMSEKAYAKQFLLDGGFGTGEGRESVLFLINMKTRMYTVFEYNDKASGYKLTDDEIDEILDRCRGYMKAGKYYEAADEFIDSVVYYAQVDYGRNYAEGSRGVGGSPSAFTRWMISLAAGGILGAVITAISVKSRNHDKPVSAGLYSRGPVDMIRRQDHFVRTTVAVHRISSDSDSGGGGDSGGSSGGTSGGGHGGSSGF